MLGTARNAGAQGQADPGSVPCSLVLNYVSLDAADYRVFQAFLQGYRAVDGAAAHAESLLDMTTALDYCRQHPAETFVKAAKATVTK